MPIRFGSDLQLANQIITETACLHLIDYATFAKEQWKQLVKKYLIEDAKIEPTVTLRLTDNWVEFNLRYIVDFKKRRMTKDHLYKAIYAAIEKTEGKVVIASATFEVVGVPELKVDLGKKD